RASISALGCPCSGAACSSAGFVSAGFVVCACAPSAKAAAEKAAASHSGAVRSGEDGNLTDCSANDVLSEPPSIPRAVSIVGALTTCGAGDGLFVTTYAHAAPKVTAVELDLM